MTTYINTDIEQGADWEYAVKLLDAGTNAPFPSFGSFIGKMEGKYNVEDASPCFSISTTNQPVGRISLNDDGTLRWRLRASVTKDLNAPSKIFYDMLLLAPDGSILKPVKGELTVNKGVAKL